MRAPAKLYCPVYACEAPVYEEEQLVSHLGDHSAMELVMVAVATACDEQEVSQ